MALAEWLARKLVSSQAWQSVVIVEAVTVITGVTNSKHASNDELSRLSNHLDNMLVTVKGCLLLKVLMSFALIA